MPVITIKVSPEVFNILKQKNPYHGAISRIVRSAIRGINKGIEFNPEGSIIRINQIPVTIFPTSTILSLFDLVQDQDHLQALAKKSASNINELFNSNGIYGKEALEKLFETFEVSSILQYKWVSQESSDSIIIYIEKSIFKPTILKNFLYEFVKYFCELNRLILEVSGSDIAPIYRVTKKDGGVFI